VPNAKERRRLDALGQRIGALKAARRPPPRKPDHVSAGHLAWRMVLELVIGLMIGFGIGYGLDRLLGTIPVFLVVFTLLGFAAGVKTMIRSAREAQTSAGPERDDDGIGDRSGPDMKP